MKIIVINGQGGVGKDSFVGYCGCEEDGIYNLSIIDGIKYAAQQLGWFGGKELKDRKFLSDLKDLAAKYNDFPFQHLIAEISIAEKKYRWYHESRNEFICFVHARELEDIDRLVYDYGARALIIRCPDVEGKYGNHADDQVFEVDYDYEIWNTEDLYQLKSKAENFIAQIREEEWESDLYGKDD